MRRELLHFICLSLLLSLLGGDAYAQNSYKTLKSNYTIKAKRKKKKRKLKKIKAQSAPSQRLKTITGATQTAKQRVGVTRVEEVSIRGGEKTDTGFFVGDVSLQSSLSDQGQMEMIPLDDYKALGVSKVPGAMGASGHLKVDHLQDETFAKVFRSSLGDYGFSGGVTGKESGLILRGSYSQELNEFDIYDHKTDTTRDLRNDEQGFGSFSLEFPVTSDLEVKGHFSSLDKGIPGMVGQTYDDISERKTLGLVRVKKGWGKSIPLSGSVYYKNFGQVMTDPQDEIGLGITEYTQAENQFGGVLKARSVVGGGMLYPSLRVERDSFDVANTKQSSSTYNRNQIEGKLDYKQTTWNLSGYARMLMDDYNPGQSTLNGFVNTTEAGSSTQFVKGGSFQKEFPLKNKALKLFTLFSYAEKAPSLRDQFGSSATFRGDGNLNVERHPMVEGGIRYHTGRNKMEASIYHARPQDLIVYEQVSFNAWSPKNIGAAWLTGVELSASSYDLPWDLGITGKASFQDALNDSAESTYAGYELPGRSRWKGGAELEKGIGRLFEIRYGVEYWSSFFTDESNTFEYPGAFLHNFSFLTKLGKSDQFQMLFQASNLFDQTTGDISTSGNLVGTSTRALQDQFGNYIPGRTLSLELKYVF